MAQRDTNDVFADVARALADEGSLEDTLTRIVEMAVQTVPGASYAAVSLVRQRREVSTVAASDEVCRRVDDVQYETGQGPCLDAIWEQEVVRIDDLSSTERWPDFADRAVALGVRSMLAVRLFLREGSLAALNLYAEGPGAFPERAEHLAQVFAAHAAVAYEHARETDGLQAAMLTRVLIGQAQGILMAQRQVTAGEAFALLREASQARNVKLRDVAQSLVDTGELADR